MARKTYSEEFRQQAVDLYLNTRRRHSHCGNVSPNGFEVSRASTLAIAA
ncbi:hypothetical protein [Nocardiopsis deserti]|nr:hypothetical protein [Nocardiopsis deserti]